MGVTAFAQAPEHHSRIAAAGSLQCHWHHGTGDAWNMPAALWTAPAGYGEETFVEEMPHHTLAIALRGSTTKHGGPSDGHRVDGRATGRITVHAAGEDGNYLAGGSFHFAHLYFRQALLEELAHADEALDPGTVRLRPLLLDVEDRELRTMADAYLARAADPLLRPSALEMDARAVLIGMHLLRFHATAGLRQAPRAAGGLAPAQLRRVCELMQDRLAQDVSLDELAAVAGLSRWHFCRAFKQSTGAPPHQWRLARRMERARELLERTDLPVTGVAAAIGYDDPGQFATTFRNVVGCAPSRYRQERRQ